MIRFYSHPGVPLIEIPGTLFLPGPMAWQWDPAIIHETAKWLMRKYPGRFVEFSESEDIKPPLREKMSTTSGFDIFAEVERKILEEDIE